MREEWSARGLRDENAGDDWRDAVSSTHLPWALDRGPAPTTRTTRTTRTPRTARTPRIEGRIVRYRLGEIDLVECWTPPCSGRRRRAQINGTDGEYVGVLCVVRGREVLQVDGAECAVTGGEVVVWPSAAAVEFAVPGPLFKRTLLVPRARFLEVTRRPEALAGRVLASREAAALFTTYLHLIATSGLTPHTAPAAGAAALDLLAGLSAQDAGAAHPSSHRELLAAAKAYIEAHLAEPDLTAATIAAAVAVSPRLLYVLFEEEGDAVHAYVRRRRLARAHADLTRPGGRRPTVAAVAARRGFGTADALAKAYRRQYGVSPTRAAQPARAAQAGSPADQAVHPAASPA